MIGNSLFICRFNKMLCLMCFFVFSKMAYAEKTKYCTDSMENDLFKSASPSFIYPYETNYIIYSYTDKINKEAISSYSWGKNAKKDELAYQLSFAIPIWCGLLGDNSLFSASYTQRSFWQVFNQDSSAPFRETNYEPQFFFVWQTDYNVFGWQLSELELGFNHQSNGRSQQTSRSWNRIYSRALFEKGNWQIELKPWYRLPEKAESDDNPLITRYLGHYRLQVGYRMGEAVLSAQGGYNWNSGYGHVQLGVSYPLTKYVRVYTQLFSGYGESLIDHNFSQTRIGLGFMLNDIM